MPVPHPDLILYPEDTDFNKQSIEIPGTRRQGQTGIYRNAPFPEPIRYDSPDGRSSLHEMFQSGLNRVPNGPCLGHRPVISTNPLKFAPYYVWETYSQVDERRRNLGSAFELLWKQGRAGGGEVPTIGIWSQNRPEWQIVDHAAAAYAKVTVSLYDTLGADAVEFICNHAEVTLACVSAAHLPTLLSLAPKLRLLKVVVCLDELNAEARHVVSGWIKHRGLEFFSIKELEALGKANRLDITVPTPEQIYSICYTSGTTGNPKGVILTHGQVSLATCMGSRGLYFTDPGFTISYLPLAHIFGRVVELATLNLGGGIGYFTGDPLRLLEDCQILRPTYFPAVPRVLNRIYQVANATGDVPGFKGDVFRRAVSTKLENLRMTGKLTHPFWDRIVFKKIQHVLGGRIESIITGSAPISKAVVDFLKIAFACDVLEGAYSDRFYVVISYGLTETTAIATKTLPGDKDSGGTTGPPQPGAEVKLVDVPAMGYTSLDMPRPRGELCCRGPFITRSYYKDSQSTSSAIDEEDWLHTGDIAELDSCGRFLIIDRIKNIMKLSQGEYVALEKIENVYSASSIIAQIYVHGDSFRDHLVAIVVPEPEQFAALASKLIGKHVASDDVKALEEVARDEKVNRALMAELGRHGKDLKGFESVKNIYVTMEQFTTDNDMLTPTMKLKRRRVYQKYKDVLNALYERPSDSPAAKL